MSFLVTVSRGLDAPLVVHLTPFVETLHDFHLGVSRKSFRAIPSREAKSSDLEANSSFSH